MKKIIGLMICMSFLLTGCGGDKKEVALKLNEECQMGDELTVTLSNVSTENQIIPHNTQVVQFDSQYPTDERGLFVDVQLKIKNNSEKELNLSEGIGFNLSIEEQEVSKEYTTLFLEKDTYTKLIESPKLKAGEEGILHMTALIKSEDAEKKMTCFATHGDTNYTVDIVEYLNKNSFSKTDTLSSQSKKYDATFEDIYTASTILPTNRSGLYFYLKPTVSTNQFLIAKVVIKNNGDTALTRLDIPDVIFSFNGEYEATYPQHENEKGTNFESSINIPANSTKTVYFAVEKEPSTLESGVVCEARIDGATYFFKLN